MQEPVETYIARFKDVNPRVCEVAVDRLAMIGAPAVPALIQALKDKDYHVRSCAAKALGQIGEPSSVPDLIQALKDKNYEVRRSAAQALGQIGDPTSVPALIQAARGGIGTDAEQALWNIGNENTLPRKILATSQFSAQERIEILKALRDTHYAYIKIETREEDYDGFGVISTDHEIIVREYYAFQETGELCQAVLKRDDAEARAGAQMVLDCLNLVRASQCDTALDSQQLLRAADGVEHQTSPDTLLRGSEEQQEKTAPPSHSPSLLHRLLRRQD